jgi:hypothetical protein
MAGAAAATPPNSSRATVWLERFSYSQLPFPAAERHTAAPAARKGMGAGPHPVT